MKYLILLLPMVTAIISAVLIWFDKSGWGWMLFFTFIFGLAVLEILGKK